MTRKAKLGRPELPAADRRTNVIKIRMTGSLKSAVEEVAKYEGCSLSRAAEMMLERYFASSLRYGDLYRSQTLIRALATVFVVGGDRAAWAKFGVHDDNDAWLDDPWCYERAIAEMLRLLARYRPEGPLEGPDYVVDEAEREEWVEGFQTFFELQKHRRQPKQALPEHAVVARFVTKGASEAIGKFIELENRARRLRKDKERLERAPAIESFVQFAQKVASTGKADRTKLQEIQIPSNLLPDNLHFAMQVEGDNWREAGIRDGDVVIIERASEAPDGSIVLAIIDHGNMVLGRIRHQEDVLVLAPADRGTEPLKLEPERVSIVGRLTGVTIRPVHSPVETVVERVNTEKRTRLIGGAIESATKRKKRSAGE